MDPEAFLDLANQVAKIKMYPYFDLAHAAVCCLSIKEDMASGAIAFSRKHPLSLWFSSMMSIFAGSIIANFLLGEPALTPFKNNNQLILASAVWYVIFYLPFDFGYKVMKFMPIKMFCEALKEIYRAKQVHDGVGHAAKLFPNAYLVMIIIGAVKGNGDAFMKILERLTRGLWTPEGVELLRPTFATKASLVASAVFVLHKKTDLISAPASCVHLIVIIFFVYFKILGISDPLLPIENVFKKIFLGGVFDTLQETFYGKPEESEESSKQDSG